MEHLQGETSLRQYRALEGASHEMLQAAQAGNWDRVRELEAFCAEVIELLRRFKQLQPLPPHEHPERLRILRNIVANDAQIRQIAQPLPSFLEPHPTAPAHGGPGRE